jgi:O-acetyl-ADP-ribose deacetylase (regulator of RNase III)
MPERLVTIKGDITQRPVDAIVNAANESLLGGGGVDGAIHRAAGPELLEACRQLGGCPAGEARITPGFRLPARFVIHTVGPVWKGGQAGEAHVLARCYHSVMAIARDNALKTLAFPAISCGVYGYPPEEACAIAVGTLKGLLDDNPSIRRIELVAFNDTIFHIFQSLLGSSA